MPENPQQGESRSSVALTRNAKGETQVAVKFYASGEDTLALEAMEREALAAYERLCAKYPIQVGGK